MAMMDHLFDSRVRVERPTTTQVGGRARTSWTAVSGLDSVKCRLDLQFMRLNDVQPTVTAGKAPDRHGLMFCDPRVAIKAGDRLVAVSGPVQGTFEIRTIPDMVASPFGGPSHIEVQVWETNRDLDALWPGESS